MKNARKNGVNHWSDKDAQFLKENYSQMDTSKIAEILGRTCKAIEKYAYKHEIFKNPEEHKRQMLRKLPQKDGRGRVSKSYVKRARRRAKGYGIEWSAVDGSEESMEYLDSLVTDLCPLSGKPLIYHRGKRDSGANASLDRIDSNKGYVKGNLRWVDKHVNKMRLNWTDEEFLSLVAEIASHSLGMVRLDKDVGKWGN